MEFTIKTPNDYYNGVTEGVQFNNGVGRTNNENVRNILVNDYHYEDVTPKQTEEKAPKKPRKTSGK
ncbi:hypothetical protein MHI39_20205 [Heyndrickxia sp. FSL K6-6286]|uniref:hypothetical protein n=1 Tax=Heyndrickxia sp. FSL K6-6286 TaxID=2921510 RepID=UPI00315A21D2